jgi:hypothetical protein
MLLLGFWKSVGVILELSGIDAPIPCKTLSSKVSIAEKKDESGLLNATIPVFIENYGIF